MSNTPEGFKVKRNKDLTLEDTFTEKSKRAKGEFKTITFYLEKEMHADFKSYCAKNNISMTDALTEQIKKLIY